MLSLVVVRIVSHFIKILTKLAKNTFLVVFPEYAHGELLDMEK